MLTKSKIITYIHLSFIVFLNIYVYQLIPALTSNMSGLGNEYHHPLYLLLWAISCASFFMIHTKKVMTQYVYPFKIGKWLLYFFTILMIASVVIPYQPISFPLLSKWHVRLSMLSTAGYIILFLHLICHQVFQQGNLKIHYLQFYVFFITLELLLYILNGGVSTLLETTFVLIMSFYLLHLEKNTNP